MAFEVLKIDSENVHARFEVARKLCEDVEQIEKYLEEYSYTSTEIDIYQSALDKIVEFNQAYRQFKEFRNPDIKSGIEYFTQARAKQSCYLCAIFESYGELHFLVAKLFEQRFIKAQERRARLERMCQPDTVYATFISFNTCVKLLQEKLALDWGNLNPTAQRIYTRIEEEVSYIVAGWSERNQLRDHYLNNLSFEQFAEDVEGMTAAEIEQFNDSENEKFVFRLNQSEDSLEEACLTFIDRYSHDDFQIFLQEEASEEKPEE